MDKAKPWPKELLPPANPRGPHSAYDERLLTYMKSGAYRNLGWCVDKAIRGTGPYYDGTNLGTHYAAVRIWYSPEVVDWMITGRTGDIPDGAVIIKEQFQPRNQPPLLRLASSTWTSRRSPAPTTSATGTS